MRTTSPRSDASDAIARGGNAMEKLIGPATVVYVVSVTVAALWWASDLTRRVTTIEHSTVSAERLARLEVEVRTLAQNTGELKASVQALAAELKK